MYIPAHLNSDYLTETDIKNFYSLYPVDEYDLGHKRRISKHIDEFITYQNGGKFTSKESQKQKKKRLSAAVKSRPKNSKVFIAFDFWRQTQINKHIIKQMQINRTDTIETTESDDKKRIHELENLLKDKDTEIRKLNNKIKKMSSKRMTETPKAEPTPEPTPEPEPTPDPETPEPETPETPEPEIPEPVEEQKKEEQKEEEEEENPYDGTSEDEALEMYYQRINIKADYFDDIIKKDPSLQSSGQLMNEAYNFINDEIELLFDIYEDFDYDELFKKYEFLKDRINY